MIKEKTIPITLERDGEEIQVEVLMRYCAGAEKNFEEITDKKMQVFSPQVIETDEAGIPTKINPPTATTGDYILLALASITAAYQFRKEEVPITLEEILFKTNPSDVRAIIGAVNELRLKWYSVPTIVGQELKQKKGKKAKNPNPPTTSSRK